MEVERVIKHDRSFTTCNSRLWLHAILQPELYFKEITFPVHRTNFIVVVTSIELLNTTIKEKH